LKYRSSSPSVHLPNVVVGAGAPAYGFFLVTAVVVVSMGSSADEGQEPVAPAAGGNVGPRTLAVVLPLFAISLAVYTVRIWTRARPKSRLNAADYTVSVAMVCALSIPR